MDLENLNEKIRVPLSILLYVAILLLGAGFVFMHKETGPDLILAGLVLLLITPLFRLIYASLILLKTKEPKYALYGLAVLLLAMSTALLAILTR